MLIVRFASLCKDFVISLPRLGCVTMLAGEKVVPSKHQLWQDIKLSTSLEPRNWCSGIELALRPAQCKKKKAAVLNLLCSLKTPLTPTPTHIHTLKVIDYKFIFYLFIFISKK